MYQNNGFKSCLRYYILFSYRSYPGGYNMRDEEFDNLGSQIKELRIKMKLTQAEVANALNVTPGYISNVENNRTAMSLRILMYYARLMNISLDSLIGRVEPEYKTTALDNELLQLISGMDNKSKSKLIQTIRLWQE